MLSELLSILASRLAPKANARPVAIVLVSAAVLASPPPVRAQSSENAAVPPLRADLTEREGSRIVTAEWLLDSQRSRVLSAMSWLPDNRSLVAAMSAPDAEPRIVLLDSETGVTTVLGQGSQPLPSRNGERIAFLRRDADGRQLWIMRADGTAARQLTRGRDVQAIAWSPDGQFLAYSSQPRRERSADSTDAARSSAIVAHTPGTFPVDQEIWLARVSGDMPERRLLTTAAVVRNLEWLPSGEALMFGGMHFGHLYGGEPSYFRFGLIRTTDRPENNGEADNAGNAWRTIARLDGFRQSAGPVLSPDGRLIAVSIDLDNAGPIGDLSSAATIEIDTVPGMVDCGDNAAIRRLTHGAALEELQWSPDGTRLYATRYFGAYDQLYAIDAKSGALTQLTFGASTVLKFAISIDGRRVALSTLNAHGHRAITVAAVQRDGTLGSAREVLAVASPPSDLRLGTVREIEWKTYDGLPMRGLLVFPPGYRRGRPLPLVVEIHGGGSGSFVLSRGSLVASPLEWQMWAAKGYLVLHPDYRAGEAHGVYGRANDDAPWQSQGILQARDVLAGIDHVIDQGLADGDRVAIYGLSWGGFITNWLVALTRDRIDAAVSREGWAESLACRRADIGCSESTRWTFGGYPWEVPERYRAASALDHLEGVTTSTLFLMGTLEHGSVDWTLGVQAMYSALRRQGVPTMYVRYPDEGHGLTRPANLRDAVERTVAWIDLHLGAGS